MTVVRPPDLRKAGTTIVKYLYPSGATTKDGKPKDRPYHAYIPALISQCSSSSQLAAVKCEHCEKNRGAFASCRVDEYHGGCCLNCWHSKSIWDCSLFDTQGKQRPHKKKATTKPQAQSTRRMASTPAASPKQVRKRGRITNKASSSALTPESAHKRRKTTHNAPSPALSPRIIRESRMTRRASTHAPTHAPTCGNARNVLPAAREVSVRVLAELWDDTKEPARDYSLQAIAAIASNPPTSAHLETTKNDKAVGKATLLDSEFMPTVPWNGDATTSETILAPPWSQARPLGTTKPTLFGGTRQTSEIFYAELKFVTRPDTLTVLPTKWRRPMRSTTLFARTSTASISPTSSSPTKNPRFATTITPHPTTISEAPTTGPMPSWLAPANSRNAGLFKNTRQASYVFYSYFALAKATDKSLALVLATTPAPASTFARVSAPRVNESPFFVADTAPASIKALAHTLPTKARDEGGKTPGVGANTLSSFARHALNFIFD